MAFLSTLFSIIRSPRLLVPFGFALGGFFLYLTIRGVEWGEVGEQLAATSLPAVAAAVAIMLFSSFLRAYRWRLMWTSERVTTWRLFTVEMAALGLNNFAPVRLLDEPAVLTMLTLRDKHPAATVVATIVMTRVQDIMFTMAFAFTAIVSEPRIADFAGPAIYLSGILIVFFVLLLNLGRVARRITLLGKIPGILTYEQTISEAMRRKRELATTGSLTVIYSLLLGPCAWVLAQGMGIEISIFQATIVALGAIFFATSLPGLPGAVGTFELAVVEILALWDVPRELGIGFGLILHLVLWGPTTLFAIVVLPREGIGLMQGWRGIMHGRQHDA